MRMRRKSMQQLSRAELGMVICWNAEEQLAYIHLSTPVMIRKLDKLAAEFRRHTVAPGQAASIWQRTTK